MSRFVIITLLAIIATTSAKPYIISYPSGYYSIAPSYSYGPYYPYTPITYVETVPIETVISGPPAVPILPAAKLVSKNAAPPAPPAPAPAAPPAPSSPPASAPAKLITITKSVPDFDLSNLLSALPIQQILEFPPVKKLAELKTSKLETISGLKSTLQEKLAPIAALLP